ncbi:MAG: hypothetical protein OXQ28_06585 [Acidobacteriota bacterium]|nr:hypothetical protein [Acidobacteriota bacterium]
MIWSTTLTIGVDVFGDDPEEGITAKPGNRRVRLLEAEPDQPDPDRAQCGIARRQIEGATASSYTVRHDDIRHRIKARVSFNDDLGFDETTTVEWRERVPDPRTGVGRLRIEHADHPRSVWAAGRRGLPALPRALLRRHECPRGSASRPCALPLPGPCTSIVQAAEQAPHRENQPAVRHRYSRRT